MMKFLVGILTIVMTSASGLFGVSTATDIWEAASSGTVSDIQAVSTKDSINFRNELGYTPLMVAAVHDNYPVFDWLVKNGAVTNVTTNQGLPLQLLIGYFSEANFAKVCALLSSKNFDLDAPGPSNMSLAHYLAFAGRAGMLAELVKYKPDLGRAEKITNAKPIDLLQYTSYEYTDTVPVSPTTIAKAEETRKVLMGAGSKDINYAPLVLANYGEFLFANFKVLHTLQPRVKVDDMVGGNYLTKGTIDGRETARLDLEQMRRMYADFGLNVDIQVHHSDIEKVIEECGASASTFYLLANMSNCPIVGQCWVVFNGFNDKVIDDKYVRYSAVDERFDLIDFRVKDISDLITIEIKK